MINCTILSYFQDNWFDHAVIVFALHTNELVYYRDILYLAVSGSGSGGNAVESGSALGSASGSGSPSGSGIMCPPLDPGRVSRLGMY